MIRIYLKKIYVASLREIKQNRLHIPSVLTTYIKQGIGNLTN